MAPNPKVAPAKPGVPQLEPAAGIVQNTAKANGVSNSHLYFEVGKFKSEMLAKGETDKLVRLGLRATTAEKKHLWSTSYHLLVGPYNDDQAEGIRKKLVASGFKPQVFERGSRGFNIGGGCETMGQLLRSEPAVRIQMPAEGCVISWETYSNFTMVKFGSENNTIATANGRWVNRAITYPRDAFVYRINDDGSRTLLEDSVRGHEPCACVRQVLIDTGGASCRTGSIFLRRIGLKNCPYCSSPQGLSVSGQRDGGSEGFLFLLQLVRCYDCMHSHYRPIIVITAKPPVSEVPSPKGPRTMTPQGKKQRLA